MYVRVNVCARICVSLCMRLHVCLGACACAHARMCAINRYIYFVEL